MKSLYERLKHTSQELQQQTYALYLAYQNPATPWYAKVWAGLVVAYAFSPIDLIPDFIPVLGYLDDLILVPLGIWLAVRMIPDNVMAQARQQAASQFDEMKSRRWIAVLIVILIWLGFAAFAFFLVFRLISH
jgi:uncharacterized membrane protein YkvA (DUF1232 family)